MRRAALALIALAALATSAARAQTAPPAPAPPPVNCKDAAHLAVGFWVGEWNVYATGFDAGPIATSRIEWVVGGCGIRETYDQTIGPGGKPLDYHGTSYTALDLNDGKWRQFYLDSGGTVAQLTGEAKDGALVMFSAAKTPNGAPITRRMTVEAQADGTVRQHAESSLDDGKTWKTAYDFTYRRK